MARIQISRGDAYVAGDMMIQMFIDGRKVGTLMGAKPLDLELPAGLYTLQARIMGIHRGEAIVVPVHNDTEELAVKVWGTRIGVFNNLSSVLIWLTIFFTPDKIFWQVVCFALVAIVSGIELYRFWKMKPQRLRLSVADGISVRAGAVSSNKLHS